MIPEITPQAVRRALEQGEELVVIDVREPAELQDMELDVPYIHIPMASVPLRTPELNPNTATVVVCATGGRSAQVTRYLLAHGFAKVWNLQGGIFGWYNQGDA